MLLLPTRCPTCEKVVHVPKKAEPHQAHLCSHQLTSLLALSRCSWEETSLTNSKPPSTLRWLSRYTVHHQLLHLSPCTSPHICWVSGMGSTASYCIIKRANSRWQFTHVFSEQCYRAQSSISHSPHNTINNPLLCPSISLGGAL